MNIARKSSDATHFQEESNDANTSSECYDRGKAVSEDSSEPALLVTEQLSNDDEKSKLFETNIVKYNNLPSFASSVKRKHFESNGPSVVRVDAKIHQ